MAQATHGDNTPTPNRTSDVRLAALAASAETHTAALRRATSELFAIEDPAARSAAESMANQSSDRYFDSLDDAATTPATSRAGLQIKARMVIDLHQRPISAADSVNRSRSGAMAALAVSLATDVLAVLDQP